MLLTVFVCDGTAAGDALLEDGVNNEFLADGVTSEFPGKLVLPLGFLLIGARCDDLVIVVLELAVIIFNCVDDAGRHDNG